MRFYALTISFCMIATVPSLAGAAFVSDEGNDSGLSCNQIVKMGQDGFVKVYERKYPNNTTNTRMALQIYSNCKHKDNDIKCAKLPADKRILVVELNSALIAWQGSGLEIARILSGGGTVYIDIAAGNSADRADLCGRVIRELSVVSKPDAKARANADRAVGRAESSFAKLEAHKAGFDTKVEWSRFTRALEKWKMETGKLKKLVANLPDEAAGDVVELIDQTVHEVQALSK